jgi:hypothetical protein
MSEYGRERAELPRRGFMSPMLWYVSGSRDEEVIEDPENVVINLAPTPA